MNQSCISLRLHHADQFMVHQAEVEDLHDFISKHPDPPDLVISRCLYYTHLKTGLQCIQPPFNEQDCNALHRAKKVWIVSDNEWVKAIIRDSLCIYSGTEKETKPLYTLSAWGVFEVIKK